MFFFLLSVDPDNKCIVLNFSAAASLTGLRSLVDLIYLGHVILQFRLAYKNKDGVLVSDPKAIRSRYLKGWFFIDLLACLPLPQIMIMIIIPRMGNQAATAAGSFKDTLRVTVLLQNIPRIIRFYRLVAGRSPTGFVFETAWANFTLNLFLYFLTAHVVGSCWYFFGVQRVNACLQLACKAEEQSLGCKTNFLDCGTGLEHANEIRTKWIENTTAFSNCLITDSDPTFQYGIYQPMGYQVAQDHSIVDKYIYSVYWGFAQVSTLAGNLVPSLYAWEALFAMGVGALGLLMFALLIGNMQNFLQSLDRRRHEMQMRRYDVENFMERRKLPLEIKRQVRVAERFRWVTTRGVDDGEILSGLPEDLQMAIKCHLCRQLLKEVRLFQDVEEGVKLAIFERLHRKQYVADTQLLRKGNPVKRMYFIIRGTLSCDNQPMLISFLNKKPDEHQDNANQFCGEELLLWHLENSSKVDASGRRRGSFWTVGQHAIASQDVVCKDNVDCFILEGDDAAFICKHYGRLLRTPRVRGILRYESTSCRLWAAVKIQAAWRYRKAKKQKQRRAASRGILLRVPTHNTISR
jgi:cyclic nucleotide gated channel